MGLYGPPGNRTPPPSPLLSSTTYQLLNAVARNRPKHSKAPVGEGSAQLFLEHTALLAALCGTLLRGISLPSQTKHLQNPRAPLSVTQLLFGRQTTSIQQANGLARNLVVWMPYMLD